MAVRIFGIRHHGPGSSKSLVSALEKMQPDLVLVEGPPDVDEMLQYVGKDGLEPPVALLVYNPKKLNQAAYFPFGEFSPEWQAIKYGWSIGAHVRNMDLPMGMKFGAEEVEAEVTEVEEEEASNLVARRDPMAYIAGLAGYSDSERWWEVMFEQRSTDEAVFDAILELMTSLREELDLPETIEDLRREAYMRKIIRESEKAGYKDIAVVCGAWHAPVLENRKSFKVKEDNDLLKGIKKVKVSSTWIPWTYERISRSSGYGAGVVSPAWYNLLFESRENAVKLWMIKVARLLRDEDLDASSAHAIEGVRLAETLAALRDLSIPGINELFEAAEAIFTGGKDTLKLIREKLIIGDLMGKVPDSIPKIPFQQDLELQRKKLKFKAFSTEQSKVDLDLRKPNHLGKSHFLHRLGFLGIPWGNLQLSTGREKSTFNEYWKMEWKPEFALNVIEAGFYGNTVHDACMGKIGEQSFMAESLPELTTLTNVALKTDIQAILPVLIDRLKDAASVTNDVLLLMDALPAMVGVIRYGDVRNTDLSDVEMVLRAIVPRVFIGLPSTVIGINEEASEELFAKINSTHRALNLWNDPGFMEEWYQLLMAMANSDDTNKLIAGLCTRISFDLKAITTEETANMMAYALSSGALVMDQASWVQGFLHGSGLLLIHNEALWAILDDWLSNLEEEPFIALLPLLRRTFTEFSKPEREKMMTLAKNKGKKKRIEEIQRPWNPRRAEKMVSILKQYLS